MAVVFWEGNDGQQDGWPITTEKTGTFDLTKSSQPVPNDETRSCTLVDVEAGTVIEVYNSPSGNAEDGWAKIEVLQNLTDTFIVASFEKDQIGPNVVVDYTGKEGQLDGKVSLIKITAG